MQYKFRGKVIGSDQWVYGSLLQRIDSLGPLSLIEVQDKEPPFEIKTFHVLPESVGMWTGLKDIEGNNIYQGDIVLTKKFWKYPYSIRKRWKRFYGLVLFEVNQTTGDAEWRVFVEDTEDYDHEFFGPFNDCKVISNILDAPHLLNPGSGQSAINNMFDPNTPQAANEEVKAEGQDLQATEQDAQEKAMESEEEGGTEG